jgi:hypothetical protein
MFLSRPRCALPFIAVVLLSILPPSSHAGIPDLSLSYYVPQAGSVALPQEGAAAIRNFRVCPNNDGASSLPLSARIKIVVRDANGNPASGIPAADICVLFNGGTSAQGFSGTGADSVIANGLWNSSPKCPTVTCLYADAPTDQSGTTYITFAGSTPGSPGVATRDPSRKWGHYDSELPVYVMGYKISGRLVTGSANGSYVLRIKNFDVVGGLGANLDRGAKVSYLDLNALVQNSGGNCFLSYWLDFDSQNGVNQTDLNIFNAHMGHGCDFPNNP